MKKIFSFAFNRLVKGALTRAAVKSIPVGGLAREVWETIQFVRNPANKGKPLPHSIWSMLYQAGFLSLIIFACGSGKITADDLWKLIEPGLSK